MGVNLFIDVEGWDGYANGGMKEIFRNEDSFPKVMRSDDMDDVAFRPADFALWHKSIVELNCNVQMWELGLKALEANPDLWIECSY
jgi:hypothetical protein